MPGFTLDEDKAREWLTANVAQYERWQGGETAEAPEVEIGDGWQPADDGECMDVPNMLDAAIGEGVITQPEGASLAFEADCRLGDPGYHWLVFLGESQPLVMLTSGYEEIRYMGDPDACGAEAALSVLGEAVATGNQLLAGLDRYIASRAA